jgi:hypothetical protein
MTDFEDVPALSVVREVTAKGKDYLNHTKVFDIHTMKAFTLFGSYDDAWARTWANRFDEALAVSNKVYDKPFRPVDALSPIEIQQWVGEMDLEFATALRAWANDPAHWMPLYSVLFPRNSQSFRATTQAWYVKQLIVPGRFAIIDGDLDSGKSDHAVKLCQVIIEAWEEFERKGQDSDLVALFKEHESERVAETQNTRKLGLLNSKGPRFIANIEVPKNSLHAKYFQFCTRLSDMIIQMAQNAIDGYFSVLVLDEMGMTYNRKRTTSRHNFSLEGIFRLVRKFNASVIVITQNKELDLPEHLRRPDKGAKTIVEKIKKEEAIYTVYGVPQLYKQRVHAIPPTTITYDTQAAASLAIDVDPRTLVEEVELQKSNARATGEEWATNDTFKAMIRYCENLQKGKEGQSLVLKQRVLAMLQSINPSTGERFEPEEIAEELGVSEEFVDEAQQVVHAVGENPTPDADVIEERVLALHKAKIPKAEVARLAGVQESFVDLVLAKQKTKKKPSDPKPPPPPAAPSGKVVEIA